MTSLCSPGWLEHRYVAQAAVKQVVLLPQPPRHAPLHVAGLGICISSFTVRKRLLTHGQLNKSCLLCRCQGIHSPTTNFPSAQLLYRSASVSWLVSSQFLVTNLYPDKIYVSFHMLKVNSDNSHQEKKLSLSSISSLILLL